MSRLIFPDFALGQYRFQIEIAVGDYHTEDKYYNLISLGTFNYGFNDTKDTIFYPENVTIEFTIAACQVPYIGYPNPFEGGDSSNTDEEYQKEYFNLIDSLTFRQTSVTIWKDSRIFLVGTVDAKSVSSVYGKFSVSCSILSDFAKLKKMDPRTNLLGLPTNTTTRMRFSELIKTIVRSVLPHVTQIIAFSEIRFSTNFTFLGQPVPGDFSLAGGYLYDYIGSSWHHETYIDLLKDILATFGLIMFIYDDTIVLQPRWYFPSNPFVITDDMVISGPDATSQNALALKGLHVKCVHLNYTYVAAYDLGTVVYNSDKTVQNDSDVETVYLSQPGGTPPGMPDIALNQRNVSVWMSELYAGLNNAQWVISKPNQCYLNSSPANKAALWKIIGDRLWQLVSTERLSFKVELLGTEYLYNPFFKHFSYPGLIFRARTASIDFSKGTSTLELLACNN